MIHLEDQVVPHERQRQAVRACHGGTDHNVCSRPSLWFGNHNGDASTDEEVSLAARAIAHATRGDEAGEVPSSTFTTSSIAKAQLARTNEGTTPDVVKSSDCGTSALAASQDEMTRGRSPDGSGTAAAVETIK